MSSWLRLECISNNISLLIIYTANVFGECGTGHESGVIDPASTASSQYLARRHYILRQFLSSRRSVDPRSFHLRAFNDADRHLIDI